jgi:hypothetical protein
VPTRDHDRGIHAFMDREEALASNGQKVPFVGYPLVRRQVEGRVCLAVRRVSLWGRVVEHERGYRGLYAYPYEIYMIDGTRHIARALAARYAIDVTSDLT